MLEFQTANGGVWCIDNLISFIVVLGYFFTMSWLYRKGKKDKVLHSAMSAVLTFVLLNLVAALNNSLWWLAPISILMVGLVKEIIDRLNKAKRLFDPRDLLADLLGVAMPTLVYIFSFLL